MAGEGPKALEAPKNQKKVIHLQHLHGDHQNEPTAEPTCVCVAGPHIQAYQSLGYIRGTLSERHL